MCALVLYIGNAQTTQKQRCPIDQVAWQKEKRKIRATRIFSDHPLGRDSRPTYVCALVLYIGNAQTTQKQRCPIGQGAWHKEKTKIRATRIFSDHTLGRDSSPTYVCALVLYIDNAQTTQKQHCPIDQGAWQKEKRKIRATRIFSRHPLGRDTSPTYVCALVLYIGNAQTTQKQHFPIDQVAWQKVKIKIRATRILSDHPLGRDTSPTYVCALELYIGNAQTTQKQHCPIDQGAWQKEKRKIRATRIFSGHQLGRDTSPTYVCALVLYIGNAQTTQKQHCPIDQGAWQKEKRKIRATQIFSGHPQGRDTSPTYVCALVLYIGNAQTTQKQHCPIDKVAWQMEKTKIRATRIFSDNPLGRDTSPTYVCALVLYIGNAQTTQKQHCPIGQGAWHKEKTKIRATHISSDHPLCPDTSPTYVCALVLYIGIAQTTQKQHCPIAQGAWQTEKRKIRATRIFSDHPLGRDSSPTYVCALV